jgi:hypothetical protein
VFTRWPTENRITPSEALTSDPWIIEPFLKRNVSACSTAAQKVSVRAIRENIISLYSLVEIGPGPVEFPGVRIFGTILSAARLQIASR